MHVLEHVTHDRAQAADDRHGRDEAQRRRLWRRRRDLSAIQVIVSANMHIHFFLHGISSWQILLLRLLLSSSGLLLLQSLGFVFQRSQQRLDSPHLLLIGRRHVRQDLGGQRRGGGVDARNDHVWLETTKKKHRKAVKKFRTFPTTSSESMSLTAWSKKMGKMTKCRMTQHRFHTHEIEKTSVNGHGQRLFGTHQTSRHQGPI